jgi:NAD(P)-dependent dehydrogenase (short-subunit alcohol dehydrogenase family)
VALVTGAAAPDGIGAACARALAADGCDVGLLDLRSCAAVRDEITALGRRAAAAEADLSDEAELERAADGLIAELGDPSILVNNAADLTGGPLESLDGDLLTRVLAVNVRAPILLTRRLAPAMARAGWGRIVNIASDTFDRPPAPGMVAYITSKGGVVGLTRALAVELGERGITVNAISPGLTDTRAAAAGQPRELFEAVRESQAIKRTLVAADYAGPLIFLISDAAWLITGQTLRADAGHITI